MIRNFQKINISADNSILSALKHMDEISRKLLLVVDNDRYIGLISIGDIQRAIIKGVDLDSPIRSILVTQGRVVAKPEDRIEEVKKVMLFHRTEFMPVVNHSGELENVYFWEDIFGQKDPEVLAKFNLPVVIMAGGFGNRLKPLTNILPKPLIPINKKTMLEEIFDRFVKYGSNIFYISVNYKADLIRYYIDNLNLGYDISYFEESEPFGTAGSLSLLKKKLNKTLFVTNCDILIEQDYSEILQFHYENRNEITVVAALKNIPIPYGTIETAENGVLTLMTEKPEVTFKINTGMYILEPHLLDEIPDETFYNITDLIVTLKNQQRNVGVFPVWQSSWIDIGNWNEYLKVIKSDMC